MSRNLYLSDEPKAEVPSVYVAGEMVTVLRFEQPCDRERTKLLGWEGRFEPVECVGRKVIVEPLKDLKPEDGFLLVVTLADGKEVPFTVTARNEQFDHQVNVFPDNETKGALQSRLEYSQYKEQRLTEENERYRKEETSIDHALAALLATDAVKLTPFTPLFVHLFKNPYDVEVMITVLGTKNKDRKKNDKIAVVFTVTNNHPTESWSLLDARLASEASREKKPCALRATRGVWGPGGESGRIAVVLDASAFDSNTGPERLVLELFRRGSGLREALVNLDPVMLR
ncbi:MAG TPA: DUF2381 family protein [Archangium sp.]|nr:DUF2381 family protein [Archangium sp.]HEX5745106.1 DUF2381 family protein [Archangium sp.]